MSGAASFNCPAKRRRRVERDAARRTLAAKARSTLQRQPFSITPAFQDKYAISRLTMKTAFLAAVAATVCAEWWIVEEKAPLKSDKLIRGS